jgi:peroxiredoxin
MPQVGRAFGAVLACLAVILILSVPHAGAAAQEDEVAKLRKQAVVLVQLQRFGEATEMLRQVDRLTAGKCVACLMELAKAYAQLGAHRNATETAQRLIAMGADAGVLGPAYEMLASGLGQRAVKEPGLQKGAEEAYRKAIEIDGGVRRSAQYGLGVFLMRVGRDVEGKAELQALLQVEPEGLRAAETRRLIEDPRCAREECAPGFSFVTLDGQYFTLRDLRGKVVLLDFWATWCKPCWEALPTLKGLANRMSGEPFVMVGISSDRTREEAAAYVEKVAIAWPQFWDEKNSARMAFGVSHYPTHLVINHEGRIVHRETGWRDDGAERLSSAIRKAIGEAKKAPKARPGAGRASDS